MQFYTDGEFIEAERATVPILDYGYLYGDGCFESIGVAGGVILDLDERIDRLFNSATMLRIEVPVSKAELKALLLETASRNGLQATPAGYLRPMLSRGVAPMGLPNANRGPGALRILANVFPREGYTGPIRVVSAVLSSYQRTTHTSLDPRVKFTAYTTSILANFEAADRGADWPIFRDEHGFITEASAANVFCFRRGKLWTPAATEILDGITHRRFIQVAGEVGFECIETNLTRYDIACADEAFVTSTIFCLDAIGTFEGSPLPDPLPGPVTTALRDAYVKSAMAAGTPVPALASGRAPLP
jgi:branched-chain amino acid aminotransferase